jgi:hypothetical protein
MSPDYFLLDRAIGGGGRSASPPIVGPIRRMVLQVDGRLLVKHKSRGQNHSGPPHVEAVSSVSCLSDRYASYSVLQTAKQP